MDFYGYPKPIELNHPSGDGYSITSNPLNLMIDGRTSSKLAQHEQKSVRYNLTLPKFLHDLLGQIPHQMLSMLNNSPGMIISTFGSLGSGILALSRLGCFGFFGLNLVSLIFFNFGGLRPVGPYFSLLLFHPLLALSVVLLFRTASSPLGVNPVGPYLSRRVIHDLFALSDVAPLTLSSRALDMF